MKQVGSMVVGLAAAFPAAPVVAQQVAALSPAVVAERDAGNAALIKAEKLLNDGGNRGPNGEACALMNEALLHYVKAAVEAGAKARMLDWSELTFEERAAVKEKGGGPWERNTYLRTHACTGAP